MSDTTLTNLQDFPPGGYLYREPELDWSASPELALMGIDAVASALQMVRAQNPASGLNPSYAACLEAVKLYTCHRIDYDPRYCGPRTIVPKESTGRRRCASCGGRR